MKVLPMHHGSVHPSHIRKTIQQVVDPTLKHPTPTPKKTLIFIFILNHHETLQKNLECTTHIFAKGICNASENEGKTLTLLANLHIVLIISNKSNNPQDHNGGDPLCS